MKFSAVLVSLLTVIPWITCSKGTKRSVKWRLPDNIRPLNYRIHINVTEEALTNDTINEYRGMVVITFMVINKTEIIQLHASHDNLRMNLITVREKDIERKDYFIDPITDILTITAPPMGQNSEGKLIIDFTGNISTAQLRGFYRTSYVTAEGTTRYMAVTQMEPTYARLVFPCFDEPSFKAVFEIHITYPLGYNALSNMPGTIYTNDRYILHQKMNSKYTPFGFSKSETMRFEKTTVMSVYIVAFAISHFTCSEGKPVGTVPVRICSKSEISELRKWSLEFASKVLQYLNEYTQYDYKKSMAKVDHIGIPEFEAGAMENWGLVTYREEALLWDPERNSEMSKSRITTVVAHETAHFWFGNLVTCKWWSELFLNEGFATYFEYHAAHEVFPSWELDKQFVIEVVHTALNADSVSKQAPLQSEVYDPADAKHKFGVISYQKGGSILRMVRYVMGAEMFREGLRKYLQEYKYWTALPEDLWGKLQEATDNTTAKLPAGNLTEIMNNWIKKPGYPLLTVRTFDSYVEISQERFLKDENDKKSKWYVPVCYATSQHPEFDCKGPHFWLTPKSPLKLRIKKKEYEWFIINNHLGYFRVNYNALGWDNIRKALEKPNFDGIPELNRAQIVDDLFNLASAGKVRYRIVFDTIQFLENDTSYFSWVPAISGFKFLMKRVDIKTELGQALSVILIKISYQEAKHILDLMETIYKDTSFVASNEDEHIYTLRQVLTFYAACEFERPLCVFLSAEFFSINKIVGRLLNKNLRKLMYCYALKYSEDQDDWEFVWNLYMNSTIVPENPMFIKALGCSQDRVLLKRYLDMTLVEDSGIKAQERMLIFEAVSQGGLTGVELALDFLHKNYDRIQKMYANPLPFSKMIENLAKSFTTKRQLEKMKKFIQTGGLSEEYLDPALTALQTAKVNVEWFAKYELQLMQYFNISIPTSTAIQSHYFPLYCVLLTLFCVIL